MDKIKDDFDEDFEDDDLDDEDFEDEDFEDDEDKVLDDSVQDTSSEFDLQNISENAKTIIGGIFLVLAIITVIYINRGESSSSSTEEAPRVEEKKVEVVKEESNESWFDWLKSLFDKEDKKSASDNPSKKDIKPAKVPETTGHDADQVAQYRGVSFNPGVPFRELGADTSSYSSPLNQRFSLEGTTITVTVICDKGLPEKEFNSINNASKDRLRKHFLKSNTFSVIEVLDNDGSPVYLGGPSGSDSLHMYVYFIADTEREEVIHVHINCISDDPNELELLENIYKTLQYDGKTLYNK